jgi:DNA-binding transcriptional LysR family regulator
MNITLDQARALDALDRHGTLVLAAAALHKGHPAVLYALRQLETQAGLDLLDRRGYRLRLTAAGRRVLEHCRRLLAAEADLIAACAEMRTGWEPALRVVYDGVHPDEPILRAVGTMVAERAPTRVHVSAEFLGGVEAAFARDEADLMVAVLPAAGPGLVATRLPPLRAFLVAHRGHPLARRRGTLDDAALEEHVLIAVRGGDPRLALPTSGVERRATVDLNDFHAKRAAILAGIGIGWLPEHLCRAELDRGTLRLLRYARGHEHVFAPRLYQRAGARPGPAARRVIDALAG